MTQLLDVTLEDKYQATSGRIYVTGIQALVRLPLMQQERDRRAGLDTAGYITGYRGSPLGALDQQLERAKRHLDAHGIVHRPGVNEDLAATACAGTQAVGLDGEGRHDGVFAIWYAKGPGVDRSGDAIRHGNLFGTARHGGVLLLLGDDHTCESSTTAHQSEYAMVDAMVPVLNPAGVGEILDYGLLGIAMSRFSGAWVALKCVHDTVESTASIPADPNRLEIAAPDGYRPPPGGLNIRWPDNGLGQRMALAQEERLHTHKLDAARAFARANRIDRIVLGGKRAWLGVVTAGKSWFDLVAALDELGIDEPRARELGLRVYKVGMTWPLEPEGLAEAAVGLEKLVVVEEKRGLIEGQAKELLYHLPGRPEIVGKRDEAGAVLFPSHGSLSSNAIAAALARRLLERRDDPALRAKLEALEAAERAGAAYVPATLRLPYFCPGCPHSSSTHLPEGSKALAGIGCHFMVQWMDRDTRRFTQMGGEGASWLGEAPFSTRPHIFQNVGDGTFYHSGSLAVRAAVASGANITFKILFNDAVAMTGGQKMETGNLDVPAITRLLESEGVQEIAVVTDEPGKYPLGAAMAPGVRVHHRDDLDAVQLRLRDVPGVSALVYDQTCAAEKRRRRKRGTYPDPDERVVINELVCEGCGDCGRASNCVAIQPLETEFGRKRRIDQSACNKDFSCLKGFCPSFVSVKSGRLRRQTAAAGERPFPALPEPALPALDGTFGIVVTGVGGTGVVTIAALLGMAAHLEGKEIAAIDMIGLAQKGGAVVSHLKLAPSGAVIGAPRVAAGGAKLVLGCDLIVAAGTQAVPTMRRGVTAVVVNRDAQTTGDFTRDPGLELPAATLEAAIAEAAGPAMVSTVEAGTLASRLVGDAIGANLFLVGFAWQKGLIPLGREAISRAIELNGVAVELNRQAFLWGRRAAHDFAAVRAIAGAEPRPAAPATLEALVDRRAAFLTAYQDAAYADRYRALVERMRRAEVMLGGDELARAVAHNLFKLMAIKDEYEVARLWTDGTFQAQLEREFEGWERLELHLAPPILASRDPVTGHLRKRRFGPWMLRAMRLLAGARRLRGTAFDPFARAAERRTERQLRERYAALVEALARDLTPESHARAVAAARVPEAIRGFGHVKDASLREAERRWTELLTPAAAEAVVLRAAE